MAYALDLIFDTETEQTIRRLCDELQSNGIVPVTARQGYRSGIALGVFHQVDVGSARNELRRAVSQGKPFNVTLNGFDAVGGEHPAMFFTLAPSAELTATHEEAQRWLKKVVQSQRPEYLVGRWTPRVLLAEDVTPRNVQDAAYTLSSFPMPVEAQVVGFALVQQNANYMSVTMEGKFEGAFRDRL